MTDMIAAQLQLSPVEEYAQIVQALKGKLAATEAKIAANVEARRGLSFPAHTESDAKSAKRLADLGDEGTRLEHQVVDLKSAIGARLAGVYGLAGRAHLFGCPFRKIHTRPRGRLFSLGPHDELTTVRHHDQLQSGHRALHCFGSPAHAATDHAINSHVALPFVVGRIGQPMCRRPIAVRVDARRGHDSRWRCGQFLPAHDEDDLVVRFALGGGIGICNRGCIFRNRLLRRRRRAGD
jgi:hypothetical protein